MKFKLCIIQQMCLLMALCGSHATSAQNKNWTLADCINQALRENLALNQSIVNNEVNKVNYNQARANQLPNLNFTDQHYYTFENLNGAFAYSVVPTHISANYPSLSSTVTVYNGKKYVSQKIEDKQLFDAGKFDIEKLKNDLTLNVIAAYLQVLFTYEALDVAQSQVKATLEHLDYTERYVKAGSLPEVNLMQMQAQLAADNSSKVAAENQLQLAKVTLMQLMEIPVSGNFDIERLDMNLLYPNASRTAAEVYEIAEGFLPEVRSASLKTQAAGTDLKVSKAGKLPKVTLTWNLNTSYSSANSLIPNRSITQTQYIGYSNESYGYPIFRQIGNDFAPGLNLTLVVPIYNNLIYKSAIKRSEIAIRAAILNEQLVKNTLRKSIEVACTDQLAASKSFITAKEQLDAETRVYHEFEIKYRVGTVNATDLLVEQTNYERANYNLLSAKYTYFLKSKIVAFYTGTLTID